MSQDYRKLKVFMIADQLAVEIYRRTRGFPPSERYGLTSQIRRAAVSVPANIVEGCSRRSHRELVQFLWVSMSSASELRYLVELAAKVECMPNEEAEKIERSAGDLVRALQSLIAFRQQHPMS